MICRKSKRLSKKSERTPVWSANAFGLHSPRRLKIWRVFAPKMHRAVALHGSVPNCQSPKFLSAETVGFEPTRSFRPCLISSEVLSTTQPRLPACRQGRRSAHLIILVRESDGKDSLCSRPSEGVDGGLHRGASRDDVVKQD